eukprot:7585855-Pyramimonas_sp.AAC.1
MLSSAYVAPIALKDHTPEISSSTQGSVERMSKDRSSVGRVSPRAGHVETLEFMGDFLVLEILSGGQGWSRLEHHNLQQEKQESMRGGSP